MLQPGLSEGPRAIPDLADTYPASVTRTCASDRRDSPTGIGGFDGGCTTCSLETVAEIHEDRPDWSTIEPMLTFDVLAGRALPSRRCRMQDAGLEHGCGVSSSSSSEPV